MLNNVPRGVNALTRNVVIRHPNTFNGEFFRRKVNRIEPVVGERQTMGGMMVLSVDDETEISWDMIGFGYALKADQFQPSLMTDHMDTNNGFENEFRFLIEPELEIIDGGFEPKKNDVFYLIMAEPDESDQKATKLAFEIIGIETTVDVAPYVPRYVCNRRDDLIDFLDQSE